MKEVYKKFTKKQLWEIIQEQTLQIIDLKAKVDMFELQELIDRANKLLENFEKEMIKNERK